MIEYGWVEGAHAPLPDAQAAGEELERLRGGEGLTAERVVARARFPDSPLHEAFTWDDAKAAAERRLDQARYLIRAVAIRRIDDAETPVVRAFVTVSANGGRTYEAQAEVLRDPALRDPRVRQALAELDSWRRRYDALELFAPVVGAIFEVREQMRMEEVEVGHGVAG